MTARSARMPDAAAVPQRQLTMWHAMAVCVGMVIGTGIFRTTPLAAEAVTSPTVLLALWAFGGAMSLAGALCFAEMAAAFPDAGGDYFFLRKAFGETLGFLFAWSRFAVIHTGSMALVAFALGDYVAEVLSVGASTSTVVAALAIVLLAALNLAGIRFGVGAQIALMTAVICGMLAVVAAGVWIAVGGASVGGVIVGSPLPPLQMEIGAALVFIFLAYGGWSDAATLSAEMRDQEHGMRRALDSRHVARNGALPVRELGVSERIDADRPRHQHGAGSRLAAAGIWQVRTDPDRADRGGDLDHPDERDPDRGRAYDLCGGARRWSVAQALERLERRARHAAGRDHRDCRRRAGARRHSGHTRAADSATMVDYLSPVYWLFLTLSGFAMIVLRRRYPDVRRPFRAPFYPWLPIAFIATSVYVLYSSVAFVKVGAIVGLVVLSVGGVLLLALRWSASRRAPARP